MSGCPLDEAFNVDLQNVKIKKKKKDKLKGLITPEQLKPLDYNEFFFIISKIKNKKC